MAAATLDEVRHLVDQLSPLDQAQLVEYLAPRIVRAVAAAHAPGRSAPDETARRGADSEAWHRLFALGDEIAKTAPPEAESLTAAVTTARR